MANKDESIEMTNVQDLSIISLNESTAALKIERPIHSLIIAKENSETGGSFRKVQTGKAPDTLLTLKENREFMTMFKKAEYAMLL